MRNKNHCTIYRPAKRWRRPAKVFIYLMRVGDSTAYKIGYASHHPNIRIGHIKYYVPEIKLINFCFTDFSMEKELHEKFSAKRVKNIYYTEYFYLSTEDVLEIADIFNKRGEVVDEKK